jgi:di/tripeptidase
MFAGAGIVSALPFVSGSLFIQIPEQQLRVHFVGCDVHANRANAHLCGSVCI